ncbi:putative RNA-directed DNA polymerase from transposon BS-like 4 [Homarus americanus]|uniref:Putative RNA-directed DNA polymerase from transposon BS-like 4 n=1 Tax=Homarus americanus TaxID=6706 RepID=A0A8J5JU00_HOMAM|nr:putative RNA-directed DNA polymerase from transposon BS-like 4 [Homarus americanus]
MSLGLKISIPKSKAMRIGHNEPVTQRQIQGVTLQWVNVYKYLGIWTDKGLKFDNEINYRRDRMGKKRLTACFVTKLITRARETDIKNGLLRALNFNGDFFNKKTWLLCAADAVNRLELKDTILSK